MASEKAAEVEKANPRVQINKSAKIIDTTDAEAVATTDFETEVTTNAEKVVRPKDLEAKNCIVAQLMMSQGSLAVH